MTAAVAIAADQARGFQNLQMLGDCRARHLEWRRQLLHRTRCLADGSKQRPAGPVGERAEDAVELIF
jgi:hypothetical protein